MVLLERALEGHLPQTRRAGYFRTGATVLADTIANRVYGLDNAALSEAAARSRMEHPKTALALEHSAKYAFWIGTAFLGAGISRHTGPAIGYTAAYAHPFILGAAAKAIRSDLPSVDLRKPGLMTFLASFGLLELASTPLFISVAERIAHASSSLSPLVAGAAVAAGNAAAIAFEYAGFRFLWKRVVLRGMESGRPKDELRGFLAEFNPMKLFRSPEPAGVASSAGEYVGRLWGIVESLWLWVQLAGIATAVAVAHLHTASPDGFIDLFYQKSAMWGKKFLEVFALARLCVLAEERMKDGKKEGDALSQNLRS